jgi:hypothetical protein
MIPKLPFDAYATQSLFVLGLLVCEVLPCAANVKLAIRPSSNALGRHQLCS